MHTNKMLRQAYVCIRFELAATVYYMFPYFVAYLIMLQKVALSDKSEPFNRLAATLLATLQSEEIICCIAARALLWFYLFQPWRVVLFDTKLSTSFIGLGPYVHEVHAAVSHLIRDGSSIFDLTTTNVFSNTTVQQEQAKYRKHNQKELAALMQTSDERKTKVAQIVSSMMLEMKDYFESKEIWGNFLPDGIFYQPDEQIRRRYKNVSAHNMPPERAFSLVKLAYASVPNLSINTTVGLALAAGNDVWKFLNGLPLVLRDAVLEYFHKQGPKLRTQAKQDEAVVQQRIRQEQLSKQQKAEEATEKKLARMAKDVVKAKLFTSEQEMNAALEECENKTQKVAVYKLQRRHLLSIGVKMGPLSKAKKQVRWACVIAYIFLYLHLHPNYV
jgi:hypothetical protein